MESALVAESPAMQAVLTVIDRAAATDATVVLIGESGTGKSRLARYLHGRSSRRDQPFVAVDCGALPPTLLESELFGHEAGAFTGAHKPSEGLIRSAAGGTLFLDEIGETSPAVQLRLLRVLQERVVRPVGATRDVPVDVRVVAATHADLQASVRGGEFREDLYYRLSVVPVRVPPLRERTEDILPLAERFMSRACASYCVARCDVSPTLIDVLREHRWPGNVRELENVVERVAILGGGSGPLGIESLPTDLRDALTAIRPAGDTSADGAPIATLAQVERRHILRALEHHGGHRKATAEALGIGVNTLWRKLKSYGVS